MRAVVNAIFYLTKTGCQWEMLPNEYPNHNRVYHHFRCGSRAGVWERINTELREQARVAAGREAQPSAASVDSQSVKTTAVNVGLTGASWSKAANGPRWSIQWAT